MKRFALIPAYQPDQTLVSLSAQLEHEGFGVIVVDDGSGENYASVFAALEDSVVLHHSENRGKGAALKTGLNWLLDHFQGPYVVVTADADGQHTPEDILRVGEEAQLHPDSLVLGTRRFEGSVPLRSRLGNSVTRFLFRLCAGSWVGDTQSGLRAFREGLVEFLLSIPGARYEYEMNVLLEAKRRCLPLRELPIATVYQPGNPSSHFRALQDSGRILAQVFRFSAVSLVSFGVDYGLFCLLTTLTGLAAASNIMARLVSASVNFTLNRKLVFSAEGSSKGQALRYALIALALLGCNTFIVQALILGGVSAPVAKLVTELSLFLGSYAAQHRFVFAPSQEPKIMNVRKENTL